MEADVIRRQVSVIVIPNSLAAALAPKGWPTAIYSNCDYADAGGLMSYGTSIGDGHRKAR